ncbi:right-handed parallel beta-helix repeat-containing protein [Paenibacillaceae bacterium]|nr:right-handed parallel beta-helix repeat-containing protein [Paenibacillaceae bacterium]
MQTKTNHSLSDYSLIRITDYGAQPDSGEDTAVPMQRALAAAFATGGPVVLECPKGRYDFYTREAVRAPYYISNTASEEENLDVTKTIGLFLKGMKNLVLEGNGSRFVFHGKQTMIVLDGCENIEIRGLHMDYERPTMAEMTVERLGPDYIEGRVHPDSSYTIEDGKLYWIGEGWSFTDGPMQQYDPATDTTWRINNWLPAVERVEQTAPHSLRIYGKDLPGLTTGTVLQMRDGLRDQVGTFVTGSRDIRWQDVSMHYMHGLGIICQYSENLSFDRMNIAPDPQSGRTVAAFADFIHLSGCRGKVNVANSRFIGGHDDAINVHGTHLLVISQPSSNQVIVRFMHPQTYGFDAFFAGDVIEFVRGGSLSTYANNRVKEVERINGRDILLTLDSPVPLDLQEGDVIENVTWTPEVAIKGNYFARIPTRGILVTTRREVVIEDNVFERMTMSAVSVADDAQSWYESGRVSDLLIRGNRFIECGNGSHPVIYIEPENKEISDADPVHSNIRIENNSFIMNDATVLHAKSTQSLRFADNEISLAAGQPDLTGPKNLIRLVACSKVEISGNAIAGELNRTVHISRMARNTVHLSSQQGIKVMEEGANNE